MRLCCQASDNGNNNEETRMNIKWYKDGQLIKEGINYNQTSTDLKILKVTSNDAGTYICKAINRAGMDQTPKIEVSPV